MSNCTQLSGKSAIVTGAGQGLGEAIAGRLAAEGCDVLLGDIVFENAQKAAEDIQAKASSVLSAQAEHSRLVEVEAKYNALLKEWEEHKAAIASNTVPPINTFFFDRDGPNSKASDAQAAWERLGRRSREKTEESTPERKAVAFKVDVTNDQQVAEMVRHAVDQFGKLDIMVSNAGILKAAEVTGFSTHDWRKVIEVNLIGYFICAREAAKVMVEQKSGCIIQINSKSGKKGSFKNSAYAASKFGGIGLTQSLALEMAPHGVRVNAICPGNLLDGTLWQESLFEQYARTQGLTIEQVREKYLGQVPLGRGCAYDDVSNLVVFLASDQSSYMTGQAINVTGGQEMR